MGKVTKTFVSKIRSINEKDFTLEAVVSDETVDRYGEVIRVDAWKKRLGNYKNHPVLVTSHNYGKLINQIGFAEKVSVKDGELICKFKYFVGEGNEEADWGWKLASKFGQAAYSVGFLPFNYERAEEKDYEEAKMGKKPFLTYTDVELLEVSQVLVPANPSALAKGMEKEEDLVVKEYSESVLEDIGKMFREGSAEEFLDFIQKDLGDGIVTKPEIIDIPLLEKEDKYFDYSKETEEEEMKEIVSEIKAYIDEKFKVLDEFMKSYSETEEEFKKMLEKETEDLAEGLESKRVKEDEDNVSYIKTMIDEINGIAKKHVKEEIPVQSDKTD